MILDNVLDEEVIYNEEDMNIMFVEGFLYALEMQEEGKKASSMEELSETLSEAANVSINELSKELKAHAAEKAGELANKFSEKAGKYAKKGFASDSQDKRKEYLDRAAIYNNMARKYDMKRFRIARKNK